MKHSDIIQEPTTPLATTRHVGKITFSKRPTPPSHQPGAVKWSHSPTIMAMIKGSNLDNCKDAWTILQECITTNSDDTICNAADLHVRQCMLNHKYDNHNNMRIPDHD